MGMCQQEMVVLREQAKPGLWLCRCRCREIGQTKYGQFKLRSMAASSARTSKGEALNVGPCQSPTFDDAHVLITLAYGLASR